MYRIAILVISWAALTVPAHAMDTPQSQPSLSAEEPVVSEENGQIEFRLKSGGCRIFFTAAAKAPSGERGEPKLSTMQEYCDSAVTSETESLLLERLFARVLSHPRLAGAKIIWFERMSAAPFECELLRYASASTEWPPLLKKLGGKARLFKEGPSDELQLEVGEFIRKAGLLRNLENIFTARGYRLTRASVGGLWLEQVDKLHPKTCLAAKPVSRILPSSAEMFLAFEAIAPARPGER